MEGGFYLGIMTKSNSNTAKDKNPDISRHFFRLSNGVKKLILPILYLALIAQPFLFGGSVWAGSSIPGVSPINQAVAADKPANAPTPELKTIQIWLTAYASVPEETDNSPFITATNKIVQDGFVAANFLPFGTEVKIPEFFGDKIFTVEDRMSRRKDGFMDVWMPTKDDAVNFGIHQTDIVIVKMGTIPNPLIAKNTVEKNPAQD